MRRKVQRHPTEEFASIECKPKSSGDEGLDASAYLETQSHEKSFPVVSNLPFIHLDSSRLVVNTSPFVLSDPSFEILHHLPPSISYY
jgi:hypothetical protein